MNGTESESKDHWEGEQNNAGYVHSEKVAPYSAANYQEFRLTNGQEPICRSLPVRGLDPSRELMPGVPFRYQHPAATIVEVDSVQDWGGRPEGRQARPWVRYWARMIDCWLAGFEIPFLLALTYPPLLDIPISDLLLRMLVLFGWVFLEAVLLSSLGTTPGKWLLCISVRDAQRQKLTFIAALKRSLEVWCRGIAFGIPVLAFFTLLHAWGTLSRSGATSWDARGGYVVIHDKISWARILMAFAILMATLFWLFFGADMTPSYETPQLHNSLV